MKAIKIILATVLGTALISGCWKEPTTELGELRHQVINLKAAAGDEEVTLSWDSPTKSEYWDKEPSDYLITYLDADSKSIQEYSGGATSKVITGLQNGRKYTFQVQALYGDLVSGYVAVSATPTTSRFPVKDLSVTFDDKTLNLFWTKPDATPTGYRITWLKDGDPETAIKEATVPADATSYTITGLENDVRYNLAVYAIYAKGPSEAVTAIGTPSLAVPWSVDKTAGFAGEKFHFVFDTNIVKGTDITWSWDTGAATGPDVEAAIDLDYSAVSDNTPVKMEVSVSANVAGTTRNWTFEIILTPYKLYYEIGTANSFRYTAPTFSPDGKTMYVVPDKSGSAVYAFDLDAGTLKWESTAVTGTGIQGRTSPTVNPVTGDIYFCSTGAGGVYALKPDGSLKWKYEALGGMDRISNPVVSKDGSVVYFTDANKVVEAVNAADGSKIWTSPVLVGLVRGMLIYENEIFCACNGTTGAGVFLKASDGTIAATADLGKAPCDGYPVAADPRTGMAYICCAGSNSATTPEAGFTVINLISHTQVAYKLYTTNNIWEPVINKDGLIMFGDKHGNIAAVSPNDYTTSLWSIAPFGGNNSNAYNYAHPCADTEGNMYIANGGTASTGVTYKVSPTGEILQTWPTTSLKHRVMAGQGLMNGVFYIITNQDSSGNYGLVLGKYVGANLATEGWPCHGGNPQGSGLVK